MGLRNSKVGRTIEQLVVNYTGLTDEPFSVSVGSDRADVLIGKRQRRILSMETDGDRRE